MPPSLGAMERYAEILAQEKKTKEVYKFLHAIEEKKIEEYFLERTMNEFYDYWRDKLWKAIGFTMLSFFLVFLNIWFLILSGGLLITLFVFYSYFSIFYVDLEKYNLSSKNQKNREKSIINIKKEIYETISVLILEKNQDISDNIPLKKKECEDYLSQVSSFLKEREQSKKSLEDVLKFLAE